MTDRFPLSPSFPFESTDEEDHHPYLTLFDDHPQGERILVSPHKLFSMRIEKGEMRWFELMYEWKTQTTQLYDVWCLKVMGLPGVTNMMYQAGVKKALCWGRHLLLMKHHGDLKLLVSWWSCKSHTFYGWMGRPQLLKMWSMQWGVLEKEDEVKLRYQTSTMIASRTFGKSIYTFLRWRWW